MTRLTPNERKLLASIQLHADMSFSEAAKVSGFKEHTVRYSLQRLESGGVISRKVYINVFALGLSVYTMFFSLGPHNRTHVKKLTEFLIESPEVSYIAEVGGGYRFEVDICVRDASGVSRFMDKLWDKFGNILNKKDLVTVLAIHDFPMKFLERGKNSSDSLTIGTGDERTQRVAIDQLDHRILSRLSRGEQDSVAALSKALGQPHSTVAYRLRRLKEAGVIVGMRYLIDTNRFQMQSFSCLISTRGSSSRLREEMFRFCKKSPNVYYLLECLGAWDFGVGLVVEDVGEILEFDEALHEQFGASIARIASLPLFGYRKVSHYPYPEQSDPPL